MRRLLGIAAAVVLASAGAVQAQSDYPNKPIVIVVPYAAGGPSDGVTRILADELSKVLKQNIVIDNKGGGGTVIGTALVGQAKPDGYTLGQVAGSFVVNPSLRPDLPYDTLKDFEGIAVFNEAAHAIVAHPGFGPNTLAELIAEGKKRTDKPLTFASAGVGSGSHMSGELLQKRAGVTFKHIAYAGEAKSTADVVAGRVDFQVGTWATQRPLVEAGKTKLIAVIYRNRLPEAPNAQNVDEVFPGFSAVTIPFNALVAPRGVPADVKAKLGIAIKAAVESKNYQDRVKALGSYPRFAGPEETDAFIREEIKIWSDVAKSAGIKLD
jgi:tripartite-type tricarboxylate transporter receptor subunit TctC